MAVAIHVRCNDFARTIRPAPIDSSFKGEVSVALSAQKIEGRGTRSDIYGFSDDDIKLPVTIEVTDGDVGWSLSAGWGERVLRWLKPSLPI